MNFVENFMDDGDSPLNGIKLGYNLVMPEQMLHLSYDEFITWLHRHMQEQNHIIFNAAVDKFFERQPTYNPPPSRTEFTGM
jgi:hypothetical protein